MIASPRDRYRPIRRPELYSAYLARNHADVIQAAISNQHLACCGTTPQIEVKSLEQLHSYYADYAEIADYNLPMSVHQYNVYGLKAAYEGQLAWGVEILEAGIQSFPYSEIL